VTVVPPCDACTEGVTLSNYGGKLSIRIANRTSMIHPDTELRYVNDVIGYGVFATRHIPRGTITWVRDELDQAFSPDHVLRMSDLLKQVLDKYAYLDRRGDMILCWDNARYMNHSCEATCLSAGYDFEVAVRDVRPGEELTDDYGTLNLETSFNCACSLQTCRGEIEPEDSVRYVDRWDELLREAFPSIRRVVQPLWSAVSERDKADVLVATADISRMRSCRYHHLMNGNRHPALHEEGLRIEIEAGTNGRSHEGKGRRAVG
jgi:uncharacterized protein